MSHLFATTDLERSYRVNLNIIALDGRPRVMGLKEMLARVAGVPHARRSRAASSTASAKVARAAAHPRRAADCIPQSRRGDPHHPPRGRAEAGADEALQALGRAGRGDPRDTRLRHLAKLEEMKIREEQKTLAAEREELEALLKSKARLKKLIARGDPRRRRQVRRRAAHQDHRARGRAGDRRDQPHPERAGDGGTVDRRLGARGEGSRHRGRCAFLQERRCLPGARPRTEPAARRVHRQYRAHL